MLVSCLLSTVAGLCFLSPLIVNRIELLFAGRAIVGLSAGNTRYTISYEVSFVWNEPIDRMLLIALDSLFSLWIYILKMIHATASSNKSFELGRGKNWCVNSSVFTLKHGKNEEVENVCHYYIYTICINFPTSHLNHIVSILYR